MRTLQLVDGDTQFAKSQRQVWERFTGKVDFQMAVSFARTGEK